MYTCQQATKQQHIKLLPPSLAFPRPAPSLQEDLILPHHLSFHELIINKARGKSGPLFDFGVKDDIRLLGDASMESQDVHAGKVRGGAITSKLHVGGRQGSWQRRSRRAALG